MDDDIIRDYFNWVFDEIIPWVNEFHPVSVSQFKIPNKFPGIIDIENLEMEVMDNYIKFGMDPEFKAMQGEPNPYQK